jgi:hypothetical protein
MALDEDEISKILQSFVRIKIVVGENFNALLDCSYFALECSVKYLCFLERINKHTLMVQLC